MNVQLMTEDQYKVLVTKLENLTKAVENLELRKCTDQLLDSQSFERLLGISKSTAQSWRDQGMIAFSQIGTKIYYKMEDVEMFLKAHKNPAFKKGYKS